MPDDLPIRCHCGTLRGTLLSAAPADGIRCVCYCDDCQAFVAGLEPPVTVLDDYGGTGLFQTSPARLTLSAGSDRLACLRLTAKGPLRWYANCCRTPIGNTLATAAIPFVGVFEACIDAAEPARDAALGPVQVRIMTRHASAPVPTLDAHPGFSFGHVLDIGLHMLRWRLHGDHKRTPFFHMPGGAPVAQPALPDPPRV